MQASRPSAWSLHETDVADELYSRLLGNYEAAGALQSSRLWMYSLSPTTQRCGVWLSPAVTLGG